MSKAKLPAKAYGSWPSDLDIESLLTKPSAPEYPFKHQDQLYFLQSLPDEKGRVALVKLMGEQLVKITPAGFSIRTSVHEYGGKAFAIAGDRIVFCNQSDNGLYHQKLEEGAIPECIFNNAQSKYLGFTDLCITQDLNWVIAITEQKCEVENKNFIVALPLSGTAEPVTLIEGADFYGGLCMSPDDSRLAWFQWQNPYMPWDQSELYQAVIQQEQGNLKVIHRECIFSQPDIAVCQPGFMHDHGLVFISEWQTGYWNFFRWQDDKLTLLTQQEREYGEAHWLFGQKRWQPINEHSILAVATEKLGDYLVLIEWQGEEVREDIVSSLYSSCAQLSMGDQACLFVASFAHQESSIMQLDLSGFESKKIDLSTDQEPSFNFQPPIAITYPTRDGGEAHAWFYSPKEGRFQPPEGTLPPLMVMVHGGPTARATSGLHPVKQYFISLGFAVLDVNHRGSTGYGREFRQALLGRWGDIDVDDVIDAINYVKQQEWVNPQQICIRGSSAGGYAVLRALTEYPDVFNAGSCYYGIGNLITLSEITHKFEGKYTDRLVGEVFDKIESRKPESNFMTRSPIFSIDRLDCPLILFQGLEDKIVPPEVSQEVVDALKLKGIKYEYVEYPDEGHGFRQAETRIHALQSEIQFINAVI